ncbi:hypothetical protein ACIQVO_38700 [Streptomyces sp. NPDC101062]|uniref:hypothetical protein n=1 Tax=unclassified Streptomyces TaxID=2593676 RepID=UPI00381FA0C0
MNTDQAQTGTVDVLLAAIDEVLADAETARPTVEPAPAPAPSKNPTPGQSRAAEPSAPLAKTVGPVTDRFDVPRPAAPELRPAPDHGQDDWWDRVYKDQNADLDTNTGNLPGHRPLSDSAPVSAQTTEVDGGAPATAADLDKHQELGAAEQGPAIPPDGAEQERAATAWARIAELLFVQKTSSESGAPKDPNHRLRQLAYNGSAAGVGWGLGLVSLFEHVVDGVTAYAVPITGMALAAGVTLVALRIKGSGFVLIGALGLTTLFQLATPDWVVGFGIPLVVWPIDARLRIWLQRADPTAKAWKAVAWVLRIPLATAAIALILHGTN